MAALCHLKAETPARTSVLPRTYAESCINFEDDPVIFRSRIFHCNELNDPETPLFHHTRQPLP